MSETQDGPVMLYDGLCGFCDGTVQFVLRHDPGGRMRFAALQGAHAAAFLERHPELRSVDSLIVVEPAAAGRPERVHVRSGAVVAIARYLGGGWRVAELLRLVPRPLRDWGYDLFARYRYRVFGKFDACPLPAPEVRSRFID